VAVASAGQYASLHVPQMASNVNDVIWTRMAVVLACSCVATEQTIRSVDAAFNAGQL